MKLPRPKPTPALTKPPRRRRLIGPIVFAPPPIAGQQAFNFDFEPDEEPSKDE